MRKVIVLSVGIAFAACGSSGSDSGGGAGTGGAATGGSGGTVSTGGSGGTGGVGPGNCVPNQSPSTYSSPDTRRTVTGSEGSFTDQCDADGNLIDYHCETQYNCDGSAGGAGCPSFETGKVGSQVFDCEGTCENGSCEARCPEGDDSVIAQGTDADGKYLFDNTVDGRRYACVVTFTGAGCVPGTGGPIDSLGTVAHCTGGDFSIGVGGCSYKCTFVR